MNQSLSFNAFDVESLGADEVAKAIAVPNNEMVRTRVAGMINALTYDPAGYQMNECAHCHNAIARRFPLEGKPGKYRHIVNAHSYCPNQAPDAGKFFVAEPVMVLPSEAK
jgi:hypothetical protein